MPYPVLAQGSTWYKGSTPRANITTIGVKGDFNAPQENITEQWDASAAENNTITCYVMDGHVLIISANGAGKVRGNPDSSAMFYNVSNPKDNFSASHIQGLELFDMSEVTNLKSAFQGTKFTELDLSSWDVHNVTNLQGTFQNNQALTRVNVVNWNTSNVTNMIGTFNLCKSLQSLDVHSWNTEKVTSFWATFGTCKQMTSLSLFRHNSGTCTDMHQMFAFCENVPVIDVAGLNVSHVTNMSKMFANCVKVQKLDVAAWNTSNVQNFSGMFGCTGPKGTPDPNNPSQLVDLDTSTWNVSNATDMSFMFYGCSSLIPHINNWDVRNVEIFDHFMAHTGWKDIDVSNWHVTNKCTHTGAMFHSFLGSKLDLSNFDLTNVITTNQMFEHCYNLKTIVGIENIKTPNNIAPDEMFQDCTGMEELDLSNFDTRQAKNGIKISENGGKSITCSDMFTKMLRLRKITFGPNFAYNGDGTNTVEKYKALLPTPNPVYIPNADGYWYTKDGSRYSGAEAVKHVPATYYASKELAGLTDDTPIMMRYKTMCDIEDAITEKTGVETNRQPKDMPEAIRSISNAPSGNNQYEYIGKWITDKQERLYKDTTPDGEPFNFKAIFLKIKNAANQPAYVQYQALGWDAAKNQNIVVGMLNIQNEFNTESYTSAEIEKFHGFWKGWYSPNVQNVNKTRVMNATLYDYEMVRGDININLLISKADLLPGTEIEMWGVWADN